jgi:DNA repair exonuclease SbcCD ATPase subunit
MGITGFFTAFGKEKFDQLGRGLMQKIVSWDPEAATEAEIQEMLKELDKITSEAGKAMAEYRKEQAEADAIQKNYDRYLAAAELLNKQVEDSSVAGNTTKSNELSSSLGKLVQDLESMKPEVERELHEANEAKAYYEEVRELAEVTASKVKSARSQLEAAKRRMRQAEIDKQRQENKAQRAEYLAGLKKDASSLGYALEAMNREAEASKAKAQANELKAKLLSPEKEKEDENIKAALRSVSGQPVLTESFSDRLAALKKK